MRAPGGREGEVPGAPPPERPGGDAGSGPRGKDTGSGPPGKRELRAALIAARGRRPQPALDDAARRLRGLVLDLPEVAALAPGTLVAAYAELPGEPPTRAVRTALRERGVRVVLPVLLPDGDLDWVAEEAPDVRLGRAAVAAAGVALVPGLAVGADGTRLGRGGGSYDRVLARLRGVPVVCLLWPEEVLDAVPAEPHDRRVDAVVTPEGVVRFPP